MLVSHARAKASRAASSGNDFMKALNSMPPKLHQKVPSRQHHSVSSMSFTLDMDEKTIRRINFQRLCEDKGLSYADLSRDMGRRASYWRDLLTDPAKSFGEKIAREIESHWGLPRHWLDERHLPGAGVAQSLSLESINLPRKPMSLRELENMKSLPQSFEVTLVDDAMAPDFPAGTVVTFASGGAASFGHRVLVRDPRGGLHFRLYAQSQADEWIAKPLNERGAFLAFEPKRDGARVVAVKTGHFVPGP